MKHLKENMILYFNQKTFIIKISSFIIKFCLYQLIKIKEKKIVEIYTIYQVLEELYSQ